MIVAVLGIVVTLLVFFAVWITIQLGTTQTALLESNEHAAKAVIHLADAVVELEKDIKGIEEDLAEHIRTLAVKVEEDNHNLSQHILDVSAEFRKDFLNREASIHRKLKSMEELINS